MIPSNDDVERDLLRVRPGEVVRIDGYLVVATKENGSVWRSSLTRKDAGDGACELIWIENIISYTPEGASSGS
jgi:hypothetical protein